MTDAAAARTVWDLVVVGAGPAGAAAALAARRARPEARVLLVDRTDFPRDKPCGDGVAPHALDVLAELGVTGVTGGHPPVSRLRLGYAGTGDRPAREVAGEMARPAHVVPREVLDARLVAAAVGSGAEWLRATAGDVRVRPAADGSRAAVTAGGRDLAARCVVVADGANGTLRRALGLAGNGDGHTAVAIRGYAPVRPDLAGEQRIVFAARDWPAYAWSFPVGDGTANVGYGEVLRGGRRLTRARLLDGLERLLPGAAAGAGRWRAHHLPLSSRRPRQPDGPVLLAGDAASLINPMTGEGIYYAVLSGSLAGRAAVTAADPGTVYRGELRQRLGRHLRHTAVAATLARVPGVVRAGVTAARRDRRVFDDLVELGLGEGLLTHRSVVGMARSLPDRGRGRRSSDRAR
ncbi:MAG: NAD(P)/FAD-dependent oxidoreductase [Kineosporiaceae bacterium]